jgi:hypothetical protein
VEKDEEEQKVKEEVLNVKNVVSEKDTNTKYKSIKII